MQDLSILDNLCLQNKFWSGATECQSFKVYGFSSLVLNVSASYQTILQNNTLSARTVAYVIQKLI